MESSVLLFQRCMVVKSVSDHFLNVLSSVICVALEAISCFNCVVAKNSNKASTIQTNIERLGKLLREWLSSYQVIGGNTFGYEAIKFQGTLSLSKGYIEIKVRIYVNLVLS